MNAQLSAHSAQSTEPTHNFVLPTKIYNRDGWTAQSYIHANGYDWSLLTYKGYSGKLSTSVTTCKVNKGVHGTCIDMGVMMGKPKDQDFSIPSDVLKGARISENLVTKEHTMAINLFLTKLKLGELPHAPKEIEIGQIVFTCGNGSEDRRAIYQIEPNGTCKSVHLDGSRTEFDDGIRPYAEKFGIGVYYNEGECISQDEIDELLSKAYKNMEIEADKEQELLQAKAIKDAEKKAYLSQFKQADKRTTTTILKNYILRTFTSVSKVSITSDSFSGGDSIDITYYATEKIQDVENFRYKLRCGTFDGMTDMYNYDEDKEAFVIDGHIMQTYKYANIRFEQSDEQRPTNTTQDSTPTNPPTNGVNVTLMSDKGGIEVKFASKPNAQVLDKLKSLGFRWSRFNSVWWANQSSERKLYAMQLGGITEDARQDEASAMVQANEDAYFDNFCQQNSI